MNITLKICTHVVYMHVYVVLNFCPLSLQIFEIRVGEAIEPPSPAPADFKHLQTSLVINGQDLSHRSE